MEMRKELRENDKAMEAEGFRRVGMRGSGHVAYKNADDIVIIAPATMSDHRGRKNLVAEARRAIRQQATASQLFRDFVLAKFSILDFEERVVHFKLGKAWEEFCVMYPAERRRHQTFPYVAARNSRGAITKIKHDEWRLRGPLFGVVVDADSEFMTELVGDANPLELLGDPTPLPESEPVASEPEDEDAMSLVEAQAEAKAMIATAKAEAATEYMSRADAIAKLVELATAPDPATEAAVTKLDLALDTLRQVRNQLASLDETLGSVISMLEEE
jgi:predicted RNA binding protein YcfA (HicA-like mRNA interferase family)